jgi:hypothetical protein
VFDAERMARATRQPDQGQQIGAMPPAGFRFATEPRGSGNSALRATGLSCAAIPAAVPGTPRALLEPAGRQRRHRRSLQM